MKFLRMGGQVKIGPDVVLRLFLPKAQDADALTMTTTDRLVGSCHVIVKRIRRVNVLVVRIWVC